MPEASVAPGAPTTYIDGDGAMIDPRTGRPDASICDLDMFMAAIDAGFGRWGAHIGSIGDQPEIFTAGHAGLPRLGAGWPSGEGVGAVPVTWQGDVVLAGRGLPERRPLTGRRGPRRRWPR